MEVLIVQVLQLVQLKYRFKANFVHHTTGFAYTAQVE